MAPAGQVVKDFTLARINLIPGAHAIVKRLRQGVALQLARDPADKYDPNAIMVIVTMPPAKKIKIGYLPLGLAKELAPLMDAGLNIIARKAPNPLEGVCQVAYIPPPVAEPAPAKAEEPPVGTVGGAPTEDEAFRPVVEELKAPAGALVAVELPDEAAATELPRSLRPYNPKDESDA